jgi:molybdate transport system substrate-binding protein
MQEMRGEHRAIVTTTGRRHERDRRLLLTMRRSGKGSINVPMRWMLTLACAAFFAAAPPLPKAWADALKVMSAGAVGEGLESLADDYAKTSGDVVTFVFGNVGMIQERLNSGEAVDVIILSAAAMDGLGKAGGLGAGGAVPLGRIGMGLAVKAGAPQPDIATAASFKAALLAAPSIAYSDPTGGGSSGIYFDGLIEKLGIADQIRKKAVLIRGGSAADRVADGEAAMAVQNISEIIHVPGVQLAGSFPAEYQNYAVYAAGVSARSAAPQRALSFIRFLTRPEAAARWQAAGVEPAPAK